MTKYKITKNSELTAMAASIKTGKTSVLINGGWDQDYASGVVVIDHVIGKGETHEKMRDVWYILSGSGRFNLGGKLVSTRLSRPGERVGESLANAKTFSVTAGDVIDIPAGIAHQIDALDGRLEAFLVKVPA